MRTTASGTPAHIPEFPRFTPGPWLCLGRSRVIVATAGAGLPICEVWPIGVGIDQADANERLIAAAPDLFAALKAVAGEITEGVSTSAASWLPAPIALQVFAALRLAQEGRQ